MYGYVNVWLHVCVWIYVLALFGLETPMVMIMFMFMVQGREDISKAYFVTKTRRGLATCLARRRDWAGEAFACYMLAIWVRIWRRRHRSRYSREVDLHMGVRREPFEDESYHGLMG